MIKKFEDLKVWQLARELNIDLFNSILTDKKLFDFPLKDQINRSGASIMDNIAEGFGRNGNREFIQFLSCSRASCDELKSQLYRSLDRKYIIQNSFEILFDKADHISRMISLLIKDIKENPYKGWKFEDSKTRENQNQ
jgi:four helix bundle protein